MANFYFRLRFHLPPHQSINCDELELEIPIEDDRPNLLLKAHDGGGAIKSARRLTLSGGPYETDADAWAAGNGARNSLMRYSIHSRVAIDLGKNHAEGRVYKYVKDKFAQEAGVQILDDVHGLMVYEERQEPKFIRVPPITAIAGHRAHAFAEIIQQAFSSNFHPTDKQEVAFELFGAAQFEPSIRSRFLTLVMAVEALLDPAGRPFEVRDHVQKLIDQTIQSSLPRNEKCSLLGSLNWLFEDSIGRTGKLLAEALLAGKEYGDKRPGKFFRHCYDLRSQLVHNGTITDDTIRLRTVLSDLERFVADLLDASIQPIEGIS